MTLLKKCATLGLALFGLTVLLAAAQQGDPKDAPKKAICVLTPTKNSKVSGIVTFTQKAGALR